CVCRVPSVRDPPRARGLPGLRVSLSSRNGGSELDDPSGCLSKLRPCRFAAPGPSHPIGVIAVDPLFYSRGFPTSMCARCATTGTFHSHADPSTCECACSPETLATHEGPRRTS